MVYLIGVIAVLWLAVSLLCVNSFNDFCGSDDEFESLPMWMKMAALLFGPFLYLLWSRF